MAKSKGTGKGRNSGMRERASNSEGTSKNSRRKDEESKADIRPRIVLDDWQNEVMSYKGDLLICCGRQIGKTTVLAKKSAKRMVDVPGTEIIIVSLSEDQAKLIIVMILRELETIAKSLIEKKGSKKPTQNRIILKNGSSALARPVGNTGDALRGFTGDVLIIDEASRMPELAFTAAEPTLLSTGGEIWMTSTPYGKQGYFWEQYNSVKKEDMNDESAESENEMGWKVVYVDGEKAINNRPISEVWTEEKRFKALKRLESLKKRWSVLRYGQEIRALFLDELRRFFDEELIERICTARRPTDSDMQVVLEYGKRFMGNDLARMGGDFFTAEILHKLEGRKIRQVESYAESRLLTTRNEDLIAQFNQKWKLNKIGIDAGAGTLGVSVLDHLLKLPDLKYKVVAMNNRSVIIDRDDKTQRLFKEDMYDNLKSMMENNEIELLDDPDVKTSLRSVQMELRKDTHETTHVRIFGLGTHIAEGLVRAAHLANQKSFNTRISYI